MGITYHHSWGSLKIFKAEYTEEFRREFLHPTYFAPCFRQIRNIHKLHLPCTCKNTLKLINISTKRRSMPPGSFLRSPKPNVSSIYVFPASLSDYTKQLFRGLKSPLESISPYSLLVLPIRHGVLLPLLESRLSV